MITEKEFEELKNDQQLRKATANLTKLFQELELTPSLDMAKIKEEYKVVLFGKLMKVDKGAKLRYEMHRTEAAKLKMIDEFVSLEGYSELDEIANAIGSYQSAFASGVSSKLNTRLENIVASYGCDVVAAAEPEVVRFDLENDENYKQLKQIETIVNDMLAAGTLPTPSYKAPFDVIKHLIATNHGSNTVQIDDVRAYYYFKKG